VPEVEFVLLPFAPAVLVSSTSTGTLVDAPPCESRLVPLNIISRYSRKSDPAIAGACCYGAYYDEVSFLMPALLQNDN